MVAIFRAHKGRKMLVIRKKKGEVLVLVLDGQMDTLCAVEQGPEFDEALNECTTLLLDMEKVSFLSSAGIRCILQVAKRAEDEGKTFQLTGLQPLVRKTLDIAGVLPLVTVV